MIRSLAMSMPTILRTVDRMDATLLQNRSRQSFGSPSPRTADGTPSVLERVARIRPGGRNLWQYSMGELRRVRPKSRKAWRDWLEKNHASSKGVWLVYAKKHSGL